MDFGKKIESEIEIKEKTYDNMIISMKKFLDKYEKINKLSLEAKMSSLVSIIKNNFPKLMFVGKNRKKKEKF